MPKLSRRAKYVVFLSHSSLDEWIANVMAEKIEALGAKCWLDEKDLAGGDIIADEIIRGIDACHEAVVLVSSDSVHSPWLSFEIGGMRAQHKRVTPILNNVRPDDLAPMQDIKGVHLNKFEEFLAQLARRIIKRQKRT
jgi:TIR domain